MGGGEGEGGGGREGGRDGERQEGRGSGLGEGEGWRRGFEWERGEGTERQRMRDGGVGGRFLRMDFPLLTPLSPYPSLPVHDVGAAGTCRSAPSAAAEV